MPRRMKSAVRGPAGRQTSDAAATTLRIIGGKFARRHLKYHGDPRTRPMKDRVREAVFNLVGPAVSGAHALDLFAGTGALGLEALSRGAARATFIEQHFPTAAIIRENIAALGLQSQAEVYPANVFLWSRRLPELGASPWIVFCSPPYALYVDRATDMLDLICRLRQAAPPGSVFVVEADERFDVTTLPQPDSWDVREYPPARVAICKH